MIEFQGVKIEPIGQAEAVCPSCGGVLSKFPMRKASCEHCGDAIYSRVQPYDRKKRLLSEGQLEAHERQWTAYRALQEVLRLAQRSPKMQAMYHDLTYETYGKTVIDWHLIDRYYANNRDIRAPWQD